MLYAERDTNDGDAEDKSADEMDQGDLPPTYQYPDKVHYHRQASRFVWAVDKFMSEGPQGVDAEFEKLESEWYADDGKTHQEPDEEVDQRYNQSAQHQPQYVPE